MYTRNGSTSRPRRQVIRGQRTRSTPAIAPTAAPVYTPATAQARESWFLSAAQGSSEGAADIQTKKRTDKPGAYLRRGAVSSNAARSADAFGVRRCVRRPSGSIPGGVVAPPSNMLNDAQYSQSSRLARRAPRSGTYATAHVSRGLEYCRTRATRQSRRRDALDP
jgi:hypothetical protein